MRKLFLSILVFLAALTTQAQVSNPTMIFVGVAPSGACQAGAPAQLEINTGVIYTCQSGTWAAVSGGGGGGFTAGGDLTGSSTSQTVVGINGTNLASLTNGLIVNTGGTGVPIVAPGSYSAGGHSLALSLNSFMMTSPTNASSVGFLATSPDLEIVRFTNSSGVGNANISFAGTQGDAINYALPYNPNGSGGSYGAGTFAVFNGTPVAGDCLNVDTNLTTFDVATCPGVPAIATGNAAVGNGTGITDAGAPPLLLGVNGSAPVGTLYEIYNCQGADPADGNAINAKLATGAGVDLTLIGACVDNTVVLTLHSNQSIHGDKTASLTFNPTAVPSNPITGGFLQNVASQETASRTFTDAVTVAGSATITSATAAFTAADQTQGITCQGILGTGITEGGVAIANFMSTSIQHVNSATSAVMVDPIPVGSTGVTCSIFNRDSNITIQGLKIINNGPGCASGNDDNWWATFFMNVNNLTLQDDDFEDASSTHGCKSVLLASASNVKLIDNNVLTYVEFQDGYDVFGAVTDLEKTGGSGWTGDDMLAVQSSTLEFLPTFAVQGPNHNVIDHHNREGSGTAGLKMYGPDQYGILPNTNISYTDNRGIEQVGTGSAAPNMMRGFYNVGGTSDNITVCDLSGDIAEAVVMNGNIEHGLFCNIGIDPDAVTSTTRYIYAVANPFQPNPIYGDIDIDGIKINGPLSLNSAIEMTDAGASYRKVHLADLENANGLQNTSPYISLDATSIGMFDVERMDIPTLNSTANVPTIKMGLTSHTIAIGRISIDNNQINIGSTTFGPLPMLQITNLSTSPIISFRGNKLTSATNNSVGYLVGVLGSLASSGPPTFSFEYNFLSNVQGCIQNIGGVTANPTDWANVTSIGNSFSVGTPISCPPANQFGPSRTVGLTSTVGLDNHYDSITLAGVGLPVNFSLSQTATGGGGSLTDNTAFFYKLCGTNSVGAHCGNEIQITVCPASTCSNLSTVSMSVGTQTAFAQAYNVYRGTTTGGELLCGSLTGISPYLLTIVDTGNACSGAAVPTTNTSIPPIVMGNTDGSHTTTFSPSTATSSITLGLPTASGTLALTSQISAVPVRAGTWSISSGTTVAVTFATAMSATPTTCQLTPSASAATTGTPFYTALATTGFTANIPTSGTLAGTYLCAINNAN